MLLLDEPRWPAHGTLYAHLVSDDSLWELHDGARRAGLDVRAFDHDHYDLRADRVPAALAAGAVPVDSRELVVRMRAGGTRTGHADHAPRRGRSRDLLRRVVQEHLPGQDFVAEELVEAYGAPGRVYHDVRHLAEMLAHQRALAGAAGHRLSRAEVLATLVHDLVHGIGPGQDEQLSAERGGDLLERAGLPGREVAEVQRLVLLTITHQPDPWDMAGAVLSDADMAILGSAPGRYHVSVRDLRREYGRFDDQQWRSGRGQVLRSFLEQELFATGPGRQWWQQRAASNVADELAHLHSPLEEL